MCSGIVTHALLALTFLSVSWNSDGPLPILLQIVSLIRGKRIAFEVVFFSAMGGKSSRVTSFHICRTGSFWNRRPP